MKNAIVNAAFLVVLATGAVQADAQVAPRQAVEELIATDRAYALKAVRLNVVDALLAMLASDAVMSAAGAFHHGHAAALSQLRAQQENVTGRLEWAPVRGAISADGTHGFTFGFMTLVRADSTRVPLKYLSYWVKGAGGWKVAVYRRARRPDGDVAMTMREPLVPERMVDPSRDPAVAARYAREVGDAERAFSALAGTVGLGPAFTKNAAPDAMNMGGPQDADFVYGPEAIGAAVGGGQSGPSTLTWGPDTVLAASSGDLGVTIGHIVAPGEAGAPPRRIPFFTVWRRVGGSWKFVAE
jgi:ketosteroid isomerase-like protein